MVDKELSPFFSELVTTQLFSAHVKPFVSIESETSNASSLWLNQTQYKHLPFWKLIDVLEEEEKGVLDKLHHFSIQPNAVVKTLFTALEREWSVVLERYESKSWSKQLDSSHKALQWIWDQNLKGFAQFPTQKMENVMSSIYLGEKESLLHHIKQLRKRPTIHAIEQFSRHYIKHLGVLIDSIKSHKADLSDPLKQAQAYDLLNRDADIAQALVELGLLFLPLYLQAIFFKSMGVCLLKQDAGFPMEGVDSERLNSLLDSLRLELSLKQGFIVDFESQLRKLIHEEIKLNSDTTPPLDQLHAIFGKEFAYFAYSGYVKQFQLPLSRLTDTLNWQFFIPSLSDLLASRLLSLAGDIESKHIPQHPMAHDDYEAFDASIKRTWDLLGWSMSVIHHFVQTQDSDSLAMFLKNTTVRLTNQACEPQAIVMLQSFLLCLDPELRYQTFHAILILCSRDELPGLIHLLGAAISLPDTERNKSIQHALSGKLDDTYKWWNSPHMPQLWATESRKALLKFPESFWTLLFRDIRSSDISKSNLIKTLLDVYDTHEKERQLVHVLIQLFEERIDQTLQDPLAQDAQLGLMSIAVHLKRRQFDSSRLQSLSLQVELFEKSIHQHLKQALQLPDSLSESSHQDWVDMCVQKLVDTLLEASYTHPPEFVVYPFTSRALQADFVPFFMNTLLSQSKSTRPFFMLFSTLIHNDEPLQLYLATLIEKALQNLPKQSQQHCESFLNHRSIVGNQAEKDFSRLILDTKSYVPSTKVVAFNPLFELSEVLFQVLHHGLTEDIQRLIGRTLRDISSSLIRLLPSPWNQHTQSLYRALQENTNTQQALDLYTMHLSQDTESNTSTWTRLVCVNYLTLIQLNQAKSDSLPALSLEVLTPLLRKENLFSLVVAPHYDDLFGHIFAQPELANGHYELLSHLIPKDVASLSDDDLDIYLPFLGSLLRPIETAAETPTRSRSHADLEDRVISLLCTFSFKLMKQVPINTALLDTYIAPFFKVLRAWVVSGKLVYRPPLFNSVKDRVDSIATHSIQTLYSECDRAFHMMDAFTQFAEGLTSTTQLQSKDIILFGDLIDQFNHPFKSMKYRHSWTYIKSIYALYKGVLYLKDQHKYIQVKNTLNALLNSSLPSTFSRDSEYDFRVLELFIASVEGSADVGAVHYEFFSQMSTEQQRGLVEFLSFDFSMFRNMIYQRSKTPNATPTFVHQSLKKATLEHLFSQCLSSPSSPLHPVLFDFYELIFQLHHQYNEQRDQLISTSNLLFEHACSHQSISVDLRHIVQLLTFLEGDMVATGLVSHKDFDTLRFSASDAHQLLSAIFIVHAVMQHDDHDLVELLPTFRHVLSALSRSALLHTVFESDHLPDTPLLKAFFIVISEQLQTNPQDYTFLQDHFRTVKQLRRLLHLFESSGSKDTGLLRRLFDTASVWQHMSESGFSELIPSLYFSFPDKELLLYGYPNRNRFVSLMTHLSKHHPGLTAVLVASSKDIPLRSIPTFEEWFLSPHDHAHALAYLSRLPGLSESLSKQLPDWTPDDIDLNVPLSAHSVWEGRCKVLDWAAAYTATQDEKSFERLQDTFHLLFTHYPNHVHHLLTELTTFYPDVVWSLLLDVDDEFRRLFLDYTLNLHQLKTPLPEPVLEFLYSEGTLRTALVTQDHVLDPQSLHVMMHYFMVCHDPSFVTQLQNKDAFSALLQRLIFKGEEGLILDQLHDSITLFSDLLYDVLFPSELGSSSFSQSDILRLLQFFPDSVLDSILVYLISKRHVPVEYITHNLFHHSFFATYQPENSLLLARLSHILHEHFASAFYKAIQSISFDNESGISQMLVHSYLLTETDSLSLPDILALVCALGFVPEVTTPTYKSLLSDAIHDTEQHPTLLKFYDNNPTAFRSFILLTQTPEALRKAIELKAIRPRQPLMKLLVKQLSHLLPLEAFHFLKHYLGIHQTDAKKKKIANILDAFYQRFPYGSTAFNLSPADVEYLKSELLSTVNSPYAVISDSDPLFNAAIQSLKRTDVVFPYVQGLVHILEDSTLSSVSHSSHALVLDSHLAHILSLEESRWAFLNYIERFAHNWDSALFERLIQGWESESSLWNRLVLSTQTPREQLFVHHFLRILTQQLLDTKLSKPTLETLLDSLDKACFLMTFYPIKRDALLDWLQKQYQHHTSKHVHDHIDALFQNPSLSQDDIVFILKPLLTTKKGSLASLVLQKSLDSDLFIPLWHTYLSATKMPVLLMEILVKGSEIDGILRQYFEHHLALSSPTLIDLCDTKHPEITTYFEGLFMDSFSELIERHADFVPIGAVHLHKEDRFSSSLATLLLSSLRGKRSGFLRLIGAFVRRYIKEHAAPPTWFFRLLFMTGKVDPDDIADLVPEHLDVSKIHQSLIEIGYLDAYGLITSRWHDDVITASQRLSTFWPDTQSRQAFILKLHILFDRFVSARQHMMDIMLQTCPRVVFEDIQHKVGGTKESEKLVIAALPDDHPHSLMSALTSETYPSSGHQTMVDELITTLLAHEEGKALFISGLKTLPLERIQSLLWYEHRYPDIRFHLVRYLLKDTADQSHTKRYKYWRYHLISALIKNTLSRIDDGELTHEKRLVMQETILTFFMVDAELLQPIITPFSEHILEFLNLRIERLYEARTRFALLLRTHDFNNTLEECRNFAIELLGQGFSLLDILCTTQSLSSEVPGLYEALSRSLRLDATFSKGEKSVFHYLLHTLQPGSQMGRIPQMVWENTTQGKEIQVLLQEHAIIDTFGHLHLNQFHSIPPSLKQSQGLAELAGAGSTYSHELVTNPEYRHQEAERFWRRLRQLLEQYSHIQGIDIDSFLLSCRMLAHSHHLDRTYHYYVRQLRQMKASLMTFDIATLLSPRHQEFIYHIFTTADHVLDSRPDFSGKADLFVAQIGIPIREDDFKKRQIADDAIGSLLTRLRNANILDRNNVLFGHRLNHIHDAQGLNLKERKFLVDFLSALAQSKRRILLDCLALQHDFYILTHHSGAAWKKAYLRVFTTVPKHKWSLIRAILHHKDPVFPFHTLVNDAIRRECPKQWKGQVDLEGFQTLATELMNQEDKQQIKIKESFTAFKTATQVSGVNRRQLSQLVAKLSDLL